MKYLYHLRVQGESPRSLRRQVAAISFLSQITGSKDPCGDPLIRRALRGWERRAPALPDRRQPITMDILRTILSKLDCICWSAYEVKLFRLAFTFAFFGAFRIGELVVGSATEVTGRALRREDVALNGLTLFITLRSSKTNQNGKAEQIRLYAQREGCPCPVQAWLSFSKCSKAQPGPLLVHADGQPLSRFQFTGVLRKALSQARLPSHQFASHSFRIGAATEAATSGLPPGVIKRIGRWRSEAYKRYIRRSIV